MSSGRKVFLGFADSNILSKLSFSEVLDEQTGTGYQRRFSEKHSLDFRKYIQGQNASTIPLTFNLRPTQKSSWELTTGSNGVAQLEIKPDAGKILAQVDCQHRLGHLGDLNIELPFMAFIGLSIRDEMEIFNVINNKAKGLSTSLTDYHDAQLATNLGQERPELYIALQLNKDSDSPWFKELDLGGKRSSGMTRRASLRTMQKAVKKFLSASKILDDCSVDETAGLVKEFWQAVSIVLNEEWENPRKHFITKGIGVYALMGIASDLTRQAIATGQNCNKSFYSGLLMDFAHEIDWSNDGPLKGLGGEAGAQAALEMLRSFRRNDLFKVVADG